MAACRSRGLSLIHIFLIAGANKAEPVRDVLQGDAAIDDRPSAGAIPSSGDIVWLLDAEAGSLLD